MAHEKRITHAKRIHLLLRLLGKDKSVCDDCISEVISITRQQVYSECDLLGRKEEIQRRRELCDGCGKTKFVNGCN